MINKCNITFKLRPSVPWAIYIYNPKNKSLGLCIYEASKDSKYLVIRPYRSITWLWSPRYLYQSLKPGFYAVSFPPIIIIKDDKEIEVSIDKFEYPRAVFVMRSK